MQAQASPSAAEQTQDERVDVASQRGVPEAAEGERRDPPSAPAGPPVALLAGGVGVVLAALLLLTRRRGAPGGGASSEDEAGKQSRGAPAKGEVQRKPAAAHITLPVAQSAHSAVTTAPATHATTSDVATAAAGAAEDTRRLEVQPPAPGPASAPAPVAAAPPSVPSTQKTQQWRDDTHRAVEAPLGDATTSSTAGAASPAAAAQRADTAAPPSKSEAKAAPPQVGEHRQSRAAEVSKANEVGQGASTAEQKAADEAAKARADAAAAAAAAAAAVAEEKAQEEKRRIDAEQAKAAAEKVAAEKVAAAAAAAAAAAEKAAAEEAARVERERERAARAEAERIAAEAAAAQRAAEEEAERQRRAELFDAQAAKRHAKVQAALRAKEAEQKRKQQQLAQRQRDKKQAALAKQQQQQQQSAASAGGEAAGGNGHVQSNGSASAHVNGDNQKDDQGEEEEEEEEEMLPPLERKASDPVAASHLFALAEVARRKGNADEAQRLYRLCIEAVQAAEAGTVEDDTVASLDSAALATGLGEALLATKHVSHAALQLEHAYDVRTQAGATKLEVAPLLLSLASALRQSRDVPGAVAACKVAFEAYRDEHGHGNVRTIGARGAYVECLSASGRVEEAMAVCVEAVEALDKEACELEAKQGSEASMSPELKTARHSLGVALMALGELQLRHAPPEKVIETAKESVEAADGGEIEAVKAAQADLRAALEPNDAASQNLSRALFLLDACLGPDAAQSGNAVALLALAHKRCGRLTEALTLTNRLAAASEAALGPTSPAAVTQRLLAAELYSRLDRNAEAVASLTTLVGHSRTIRGEGHLMTADLLATLARYKRAAGDSQGANAALKEAAAAKRKAQENDRGGHSAAYTRMKVAVAAAAAAKSTGGQRKATAADLLAAP